jgi:dTDP-4-dehydrorhamnose 3,5-epimerase
MTVQPLDVHGAYLTTPVIHRDARGEFCEAFAVPAVSSWCTPGLILAQLNTSWSRRGTLRGLHVSVSADGQAKLVHCSVGSILDIIVDVREGSPSFGRHSACTLDSQTRASLLIPPGVAHGFLALTDSTVVYACTALHDPVNERTLDALDEELDLPWPTREFLIRSTRDLGAPSWREAQREGWLPVSHQPPQW